MVMGKCGEKQYNYKQQCQNPTKVKRKPIKIKYISSPLIVKATNAAEFRAIVQRLTGLNSDAINQQPATGDTTVTIASSPALVAEEMEVFKFPDDMSSLLELNEGLLGRENLPWSLLHGFSSPSFFH